MTVFLCCDSDSGRADKKRNGLQEEDIEEDLSSVLKKGDATDCTSLE